MNNVHKPDIIIASLPGCGMQFVMHLLLLSRNVDARNTYLGIGNDDLRKLQYGPTKEHWDKPLLQIDNYLTSKNVTGRRLYQMMNTTDLKYVDALKLVIYADIHTMAVMQTTKTTSHKLAMLSDSSDYLGMGHKLIETVEGFKNSYEQIKADDWPDVSYPWEVDSNYLKEMQDHGYIHEFDQVVTDYNGTSVFSGFVPLLERSDIAVSLNDIVQTSGAALFDVLGISRTSETDEFIQHYLNLHTETQLKYLLEGK